MVSIWYFVDKSRNLDAKVPLITAINSIGTGKMHILLNFGFNHSLLRYKTTIVITDIITAVQLMTESLEKNST